MPTKAKERALAGARSIKNNQHSDVPEGAMPAPGLSSTTYPAAVLARRFGLSPSRAALVASLAGFAPVLPALLEIGR